MAAPRARAIIASVTARIAIARLSPILGLLLCALLAPVVAHAAALPDGTGEADWIASLSGLHEWASDLAPGDVYRTFGLVTPLVYLLLLLGLWLVQAPGTRFLRVVLAIAAVADALAYGVPAPVNSVPGSVEFFGLPLLLVGIGVAVWAQRGNGLWPWLIGLGIPLAFAGMALVGYWSHGALPGIAIACCLLAWAPPPPLRPSDPHPRTLDPRARQPRRLPPVPVRRTTPAARTRR